MASFGGKVELQGESEYRKALKDITSNLKLVSSELKLTNAEFANGDKSVKQTKTSYDSMNKTMQDQRTKVDELRETVKKMEQQYGSNNEKVKTFKTQLNDAETKLKDMENATDKSTKELKEMKQGFDDAGKGAISFGDLLKANILGDAITGGVKALGSAIKGIGSAFLDIGKQALDSYADYEQLIGGVETLFGTGGQTMEEYAKATGKSVDKVRSEYAKLAEAEEQVMKDANEAYKTAGLSANEYMETVTSFSASLIQSLDGDTTKAAKASKQAIIDMADNANKMGTDISMIQNAYQGFAKQNYTMLDNLKLGYGGTKTEMERLLADAQKISGVEYDISNLNDVYSAIHVIQEEMEIAGTTAKEATETISGSISAMSSAWGNLITGIANEDANLSELINNFVESVGIVGENILPVVGTIIEGISEVIMSLANKIIDYLPQLLQTGMSILQNIIDGITQMLPQLLPVVVQLISTLVMFIVNNLPTIIEAGITILLSLVQGIIEALPELIPAVIKCVETMLSTLVKFLPDIIIAGLDLLMALVFGIIDNINEIIDAILYLTGEIIATLLRPDMLTKIIMAGIELIMALIVGIVKCIPDIVMAIPKIISAIVDAFRNMDWIKIGNDILKGIISGFTSIGNLITNAVKKVGNSLMGSIKKFFGIQSPSKLMKEEVGSFLAEGIGVGFEDTMKDVTQDMTDAIPTEFDTEINANYKTSAGVIGSNYDLMVNAFETALKNVKVVMNDREFGAFVTDTMTREVYS